MSELENRGGGGQRCGASALQVAKHQKGGKRGSCLRRGGARKWRCCKRRWGPETTGWAGGGGGEKKSKLSILRAGSSSERTTDWRIRDSNAVEKHRAFFRFAWLVVCRAPGSRRLPVGGAGGARSGALAGYQEVGSFSHPREFGERYRLPDAGAGPSTVWAGTGPGLSHGRKNGAGWTWHGEPPFDGISIHAAGTMTRLGGSGSVCDPRPGAARFEPADWPGGMVYGKGRKWKVSRFSLGLDRQKNVAGN